LQQQLLLGCSWAQALSAAPLLHLLLLGCNTVLGMHPGMLLHLLLLGCKGGPLIVTLSLLLKG
jgi:hypothetical protein